jgi:hypothetical protein
VFSISASGDWRACDHSVILLITPSARGQECGDALQLATGDGNPLGAPAAGAATRLREPNYSAVIVDQFLPETEPEESDRMLEHRGTAFPVYINSAVTGMERLVREVRSALHRRLREETSARRAVEEQMRSGMRETLTVMLLSCELVMAVPGVPVPAVEKIRAIDNLARELRVQLNAAN